MTGQDSSHTSLYCWHGICSTKNKVLCQTAEKKQKPGDRHKVKPCINKHLFHAAKKAEEHEGMDREESNSLRTAHTSLQELTPNWGANSKDTWPKRNGRCNPQNKEKGQGNNGRSWEKPERKKGNLPLCTETALENKQKPPHLFFYGDKGTLQHPPCLEGNRS